MSTVTEYAKIQRDLCVQNDRIKSELFEEYGVKKGLRDLDGHGVLTGLTNISHVMGFKTVDGKQVPCDGELLYRGYDVTELVKGCMGNRYIFEEGAYLLLFGQLPTKEQLSEFENVLYQCMTLPKNFTREVIMKASSSDIMNSMTRSILTLASYDSQRDNLDLDNVLRQCLQLIGLFPMLAVYGYHAYNHYDNDGSMYIHRPKPNLSLAENLLQMLRPDMKFTDLEAPGAGYSATSAYGTRRRKQLHFHDEGSNFCRLRHIFGHRSRPCHLSRERNMAGPISWS